MSAQELIPREPSQTVERQQPSPMEIVAANPNMDVDKLERLLAMQERIVAEQRRMAYVQAMSRLAPLLPEIDKLGRVTHETKNGMVDRKYARYEDIDRAIRPLYSAEGFSISWNTQPGEAGKIRVIGQCSHVGGHFEIRQLDLPHDSSGSKNPVQAVGSTVSYGKRMITTMLFNLVTKDEDTDGQNPETIGNDEALDLKAKIEEVGGNLAGFLKLFEIEKLADLRRSELPRAIAAIEDKRKAVKK